MHLALKSAMSRIPYTNKVGETLSSIADPAAAYSLRALGGGDPMVARVRRSDNAEKDITASDISGGALVNWVGLGNDGFVTTWYDQSGNDNHATQGTAGSQPKIVDGGAYLGELDFDGVDDQLDYPLSISTLNNTSSFVLAAFQDTTDNQFVLTVSGGSNNRWYSPIIWNGSYRFGYGASIDSINLGTPDENNHLFTATAGSTTAEGFIDGLSKGTQPSTSNALSDQSFIGAHTSSISYPLNGSISEIIIYDSDQSSNREAIETNINNHYDIY